MTKNSSLSKQHLLVKYSKLWGAYKLVEIFLYHILSEYHKLYLVCQHFYFATVGSTTVIFFINLIMKSFSLTIRLLICSILPNCFQIIRKWYTRYSRDWDGIRGTWRINILKLSKLRVFSVKRTFVSYIIKSRNRLYYITTLELSSVCWIIYASIKRF